jgi:putative DNA primase/helicase
MALEAANPVRGEAAGSGNCSLHGSENHSYNRQISHAAQAQVVSWGKFKMSPKGLTMKVEKGRGENVKAEEVWISASFEVLGACRDPHGQGWGKWLRWRDADKRTHTRHVSDAALQGDPSALCAALADEGLNINRSHQRAFLAYLCGCNVKDRVTLVRRTGWHDIGGNHVFVLPTETIGPRGAERVILDASATGPYEARGSLQDWQDSTGVLASGHALPVLAISAALAGPLVYIAGQEGGGIHIFGASSKGKTTVLQMAASGWGKGATPGYVRAWRATANGLEGAAASGSDTVLILDGVGVVDARDAAAAIYGLANGCGKTRAARDGSLREPKSWHVLTLSTC